MAEPLVTPAELAEVLDWPDTADTTELVQPCAAADNIVNRFLDLDKGPHDLHPQDKEAALAIAVQIYSSQKAPGGQMQTVDYQPMMVPHLLGPGLTARVMGLLNPCRKYGGLVVG